ncbi:HTTM domain-containing protein [Haliangium sp.]|uniref:HTTM domain-containing protein n=1 Tax=Haliangium sp. TaxID=2663208 RepID=UPI003D0E1B66
MSRSRRSRGRTRAARGDGRGQGRSGQAAPVRRSRGPVGRLLGRIDGYWMAPAPARRLAVVRLAVGGFALLYLLSRVPHWLSYAHFDPQQYRPVGLLAWVLPRPLVPVAVQSITMATIACAVPFVLGWRWRVFGPLFAALLLWTLSYRNSWGMVFHTENLLVIQVLVLGLSRSADAWSLDSRRRGRAGGPEPAPDGRYGWPLKLMCWVVVIAYVLAGVAKLRNAGMDWLWGDELRNHIALDNARKILLGDIYSPVAGPLMHWDLLYRVLAFATIVAELGAPLALLSVRIAAVWVAVVIGFHVGVLVLMMIAFPYQMFGIGFLCFFAVERVPERVWAWWQGRRGARALPAGAGH